MEACTSRNQVRSILRNHLTNKFTGVNGKSAQILKECDEELSIKNGSGIFLWRDAPCVTSTPEYQLLVYSQL